MTNRGLTPEELRKRVETLEGALAAAKEREKELLEREKRRRDLVDNAGKASQGTIVSDGFAGDPRREKADRGVS
jgi:hypothetical protein